MRARSKLISDGLVYWSDNLGTSCSQQQAWWPASHPDSLNVGRKDSQGFLMSCRGPIRTSLELPICLDSSNLTRISKNSTCEPNYPVSTCSHQYLVVVVVAASSEVQWEYKVPRDTYHQTQELLWYTPKLRKLCIWYLTVRNIASPLDMDPLHPGFRRTRNSSSPRVKTTGLAIWSSATIGISIIDWLRYPQHQTALRVLVGNASHPTLCLSTRQL